MRKPQDGHHSLWCQSLAELGQERRGDLAHPAPRPLRRPRVRRIHRGQLVDGSGAGGPDAPFRRRRAAKAARVRGRRRAVAGAKAARRPPGLRARPARPDRSVADEAEVDDVLTDLVRDRAADGHRRVRVANPGRFGGRPANAANVGHPGRSEGTGK